MIHLTICKAGQWRSDYYNYDADSLSLIGEHSGRSFKLGQKVAVVLDKSTWTRQLLEASGTFVLNVPCVDQADVVQTVGSTSGLKITQSQGQDKFQAYGLQILARQIEIP